MIVDRMELKKAMLFNGEMTGKELAEKAQLTQPVITRMMKGLSVNMESVYKVANVLDVDMFTLEKKEN